MAKKEPKGLAKIEKGLAKIEKALERVDDRPEFLAKITGPNRGMEEADAKDLTLPRLGLCQSGTPQRKKANPNFIEELEEGEFFNSLTKEIYGETIEFVPLFMYKSRIKFKDFEDGGGIDCQAVNGKTGGRHSKVCAECVFANFGEEGAAPECDLIYNYPSLILSGKRPKELVVVSLKSTAIKIARQLNTLIEIRNADTFAGKYKFTSQDAKAKGNDFKSLTVENAGWVDGPTFKVAESTWAGLRGKKIQVDQTGEGRYDEGTAEKSF